MAAETGALWGIATRRRFGLGLVLLASACGAQPDLVGGEQGRIARITDGDLLGLDTGLRVRLAEIEAPAPGYDSREDEPFAREARAMLETASLGREARLWYGGLSRDDYGRALAHVIARDETGAEVWLNGLMIRQGGARVRTWPDNARRAARLLALEEEARAARRGLWSLDHWRIRQLDDLAGAPAYALVEGPLLETSHIPGDAVAHLAPEGIRLEIGERLQDTAPPLTPGARLRLRGRLDTRNTPPTIRITHWPQVEVLA
ncbi:MAG TPA: thermonuclease family protein [Hyphomonadaceae bacterium]|nr:thermonuclease family protein [Hyphomonadaceae bacterium]